MDKYAHNPNSAAQMTPFSANTTPPPASSLGAVITAPFGMLSLWLSDDALSLLSFEPPDTPERQPVCQLAETAVTQLHHWFDDPHYAFTIPLAPCGTSFQRKVWQTIAAIPYGGMRTYGSIATELSSAARAVGQACRANPFPIIIPCHRVVSQSGIGGFHGATAGHLIDTKQWLQAFEKTH